MKFSYRLARLCGSVHDGANVVFATNPETNDEVLFSAVGNRISVFELTKHSSYTLPVECRSDVYRMAVNRASTQLLVIDREGRAVVINIVRRIGLHRFNFKGLVRDVKYSPDDRWIAVALGARLKIWHAPPSRHDTTPFVLHNTLAGHNDDITCIDWTQDSRYMMTGSKDLTCRIWSLMPKEGFVPMVLAGHKEKITACFFNAMDNSLAYTIAADCAIFVWQWDADGEEDDVDDLDGGGRKCKAFFLDVTSESGSRGGCKGPFDTTLAHFGRTASRREGGSSDDENNGRWRRKASLPRGRTLHSALGQWNLLAKHFLWDQAEQASKTKKSYRKRIANLCGGGDGIDGDDDVLAADGSSGKHGVGLRVRCAELHGTSSLLAVGLSNGTFSIFDLNDALPDQEGYVRHAWGKGNGSRKRKKHLGGDVGNGRGVHNKHRLLGSAHQLAALHTLSISQSDVGTVAINGGGEWLAFGAAPLGQLLVWEWQSETYVLKQQGHSYDMNSVAFSPDGTVIATGADDAKVKLWSASSGFCFVTLSDHAAPVSAVCFGPASGRVLLSASLDGTVRAYDLLRYKNFRTMASDPQAAIPAQFVSLAVDPSGEVVVAGAMEPFAIHVWALQTGKLLDLLSGHAGPVASLAFDVNSGQLASGSWDKTVKVWNVYRNECVDTLEHPAEVLCLAFRPDGKQLTAGTLRGQLHIWDPEEGDELGVIDGQRDIAGGRGSGDRRTAQSSAARRHFTSLCYSADGSCLLAGGRSRFVCIYEASQRLLLKKFQISHNRSRDGVVDRLNSKEVYNAAGVAVRTMDLDDAIDDAAGEFSGNPTAVGGGALPASSREVLPGATRTIHGKRANAHAVASREISVSSLQFSGSGREWAAATTDGLLVYALSDDLLFSPVGLEGEDITPADVRHAFLHRRDYARGLLMALQLGDFGYISTSCLGRDESSSGTSSSSLNSWNLSSVSGRSTLLDEALGVIPREELAAVMRSPGFRHNQSAVCHLVEALVPRLASTNRLEFFLVFSLEVLKAHGQVLHAADSAANTRSATARGYFGAGSESNSGTVTPNEDYILHCSPPLGTAAAAAVAARLRVALRALQKAVLRQQKILQALCDENHYTLRFLDGQQHLFQKKITKKATILTAETISGDNDHFSAVAKTTKSIAAATSKSQKMTRDESDLKNGEDLDLDLG